MTVNELKERLERIVEYGYGEREVMLDTCDDIIDIRLDIDSTSITLITYNYNL